MKAKTKKMRPTQNELERRALALAHQCALAALGLLKTSSYRIGHTADTNENHDLMDAAVKLEDDLSELCLSLSKAIGRADGY